MAPEVLRPTSEIVIATSQRSPSPTKSNHLLPSSRSTIQRAAVQMSQSFLEKLGEWEHSTTKCTSAECSITISHNTGRYLHRGKHSTRGPIFGGCNPPPEVWAALDRKKAGRGEVADDRIIDGFRAAHVFQGHGLLNQAGSKPRQWRY